MLKHRLELLAVPAPLRKTKGSVSRKRATRAKRRNWCVELDQPGARARQIVEVLARQHNDLAVLACAQSSSQQILRQPRCTHLVLRSAPTRRCQRRPRRCRTERRQRKDGPSQSAVKVRLNKKLFAHPTQVPSRILHAEQRQSGQYEHVVNSLARTASRFL